MFTAEMELNEEMILAAVRSAHNTMELKFLGFEQDFKLVRFSSNSVQSLGILKGLMTIVLIALIHGRIISS